MTGIQESFELSGAKLNEAASAFLQQTGTAEQGVNVSSTTFTHDGSASSVPVTTVSAAINDLNAANTSTVTGNAPDFTSTNTLG